jgi:hypothetical protein
MITGGKTLSLEQIWPRVIIVGMDKSAEAPAEAHLAVGEAEPQSECATPVSKARSRSGQGRSRVQESMSVPVVRCSQVSMVSSLAAASRR